MSTRRIGLFGGTFDPPHLGHLVVADQVRWTMGFDEVWLVVANDPWQKTVVRHITPAAQRFAMVEAALVESEGLVASAVELEEAGPSYSIDTLATLRERHPDTEWSLIVGHDAARGLPTWHRADELATVANFVVVNRPGADASLPAGWQFSTVDVPGLDISSTDLRRRLADGRSVRYLMPRGVIDLAASWGLYRPDS